MANPRGRLIGQSHQPEATPPPVAPTPASVALITVRGQLNTGRPCAIAVPPDITDSEVLSLVDGVLRVRDQLAAARRPGPRLLVPS